MIIPLPNTRTLPSQWIVPENLCGLHLEKVSDTYWCVNFLFESRRMTAGFLSEAAAREWIDALSKSWTS